jgi:hypothetical protein
VSSAFNAPAAIIGKEDPVAQTSAKLGYYVKDTGDGDVYNFFMADEPPLGQYVLHDGVWVPLPDPWYLMDKIIDGDPEVDGPVADPPEGVPPVRVLISR